MRRWESLALPSLGYLAICNILEDGPTVTQLIHILQSCPVLENLYLVKNIFSDGDTRPDFQKILLPNLVYCHIASSNS